MSRTMFAQHIGIDRSTLSQLLSPGNTRLPRVETLAAIAAWQQVSIDWLVGVTHAGVMQAELVTEQTTFEREAPDRSGEKLRAWLSEAIGYKIRHVPSSLPDLLKTDAVIRYELDDSTASHQQRIDTASARLSWTRGPETDFECCSSIQSVEGFARGEGIWRRHGRDERVAQLEQMERLADELYPTLRWFLFDARVRFAVPVTIYGPLRAALYLGQMYLVLTSNEPIRTLTMHFEDLIRAAVLQPPDVPAFLARQRAIAAGSAS